MPKKKVEPEKPKKNGRPTDFTEKLADHICMRVATNTEGLDKLCKKYPDMPDPDTINNWRWKYPEFFGKYLAARATQSHLIIEQCEDLADDVIYYTDKEGNQRIDAPSVAKQTIKINLRKWHASKLAPKFFGERTMVEELKGHNDEMMRELLELRAQLNEKNKKDY